MLETYIFILTHGAWGEELVKGTEMVIGKMKNVLCFSLYPGTDINSYIKNISEEINRLKGNDFLFIVDVIGGTPFNVAALFCHTNDVSAVSGLSMNLLITADELRKKYVKSDLTEELMKSLIKCNNGIIDIKKASKGM